VDQEKRPARDPAAADKQEGGKTPSRPGKLPRPRSGKSDREMRSNRNRGGYETKD
jgi:hypothetical protein